LKLHLNTASGLNAFTSYGSDHVLVNGVRYERSLIVLPDRLIEDWAATVFEALAISHFETIAALAPEIVLLGTGQRLRFPVPQLTRPLVQAGIGLEVMDIGAVCRTYNILLAEDRRVAAALLIS
jgi:uncharacterized protein